MHNLRSLDLDIPHGRFVVVTGPSGAGKSTLAIDAVYSEAQRRYIETFSPYARQFLERLPRPEAREISNIPAAVAIGQSNPVRNSRSTAGTLSEINYPAHLLFYHLARHFCPRCNVEIRRHRVEDVIKGLQDLQAEGETRATIVAPVQADRVMEFVSQGFFRYLEAGEVREVEESRWNGRKTVGKTIDLVIDRISLKRLAPERIRDSVSMALSTGSGRCRVVTGRGKTINFYRDNRCPECGILYPEPTAGLFSFNSPSGACPACQGFGRQEDIDWDLVVPDRDLSIEAGAIRPMENWTRKKGRLLAWCRKNLVDTALPWDELDPEIREEILFGGRGWPGVKAFFDRLERKRYKTHVRILLARYRKFITCSGCNGSRFRPETHEYRLNGLTIPEFYALTFEDALKWTKELMQMKGLNRACEALATDLENRLLTITRAGLGYLSAERQARTLSGGEVARLNISRGLGARLAHTLYVLDEPSAGLHPADTERIRGLLLELRDRRNTVIAVEHNREVIKAADMEIALGPGSGREGGELVYQGDPVNSPFSDNARFTFSDPDEPPLTGAFLEIEGARANNLQDIDVKIPIGRITCITGVSGSGKSTLAEHVLYRNLCRAGGLSVETPGRCRAIRNIGGISAAILVDQSPLSRNPRACPGSWLKVLDLVRKLFAQTPEAREQGIPPGAFSFNTTAGRCPLCSGQGVEKIDMQFLPDMTLPCPECRGSRFAGQVMDVYLNGLNIAQVMKMTLSEVISAPWCSPAVSKRISMAIDLGLGHLELGQPLDTLSSGEARRLKIAKHLMSRGLKDAVLILDEPSRGLFSTETRGLVKLLKETTLKLNTTVVMVDHDPGLAGAADWIVDLGPGGGSQGGRVLFQGRAGDILSCSSSITGRFMKGDTGSLPASVASGKPARQTKRRDCIEISGARHHNLKDISVEIPHGMLTVITGVSGSGKSSLAFDIVFAEGQRRYMEGLSSYMKQYVKLYERPDVDMVEGLTPSVAIEQRTSRSGPMSTVATLTEIAHYMRLLYAKTSSPWCKRCNVPMEGMTEEEICSSIMKGHAGKEIFLISPVVRRRKGRHEAEVIRGIRAGIPLFRIDDVIFRADEIPALSRYGEHTVEWVQGPVSVPHDRILELSRHVSDALKYGGGAAGVMEVGADTPSWFSRELACPRCGMGMDRPDPLLFSFHNKAGQCRMCHGRGATDGEGQCPECAGGRLNRDATAWRLSDISIDRVFSMEISDALSLMKEWLGASPPWAERMSGIAVPLVKAVEAKLSFLERIGLGYLALDRAGDTLSGGEAQRIRLAAQAGSGLSGITLVLDEPTIGLHPRDNRRIIDALKGIAADKNTVVVVEHDLDTIRAADMVIDLGPGGGSEGGEVVCSGPPAHIMKNRESATAAALATPASKRIVRADRLSGRKDLDRLVIEDVNLFHFRHQDISIPLNSLVVITGVSGAGKSTLLSGIIGPCLRSALSQEPLPGSAGRMKGNEGIKRVAAVDHSPIGRTPRSCPATYAGIWSGIRGLFASSQEARIRGFNASMFSFNVKGGRCEECGGQGSLRISLGILPDHFVICEACMGTRYKASTLDIKWKGRNISDVLLMTVREAAEFFRAIPAISRPLAVMNDLGIGYIQLGQPAPSLSGGEAQRLKLARELVAKGREGSFYMLDEPTTGLHAHDVGLLLRHLHKLVDRGGTVVVVEHNLDVIASADWVVDLGPGGGRHGGRVVFQGTPEDCARADTATGMALREFS